VEDGMGGVKFEQAMARLEAIVGELEKGDLPLDESLKIFEEGIRLSKNCLKILEEAERKVEVLIKDQNGKKRLHAFTQDNNNEGHEESPSQAPLEE
jgi:exodeoxyribonuclease VII small subunit